MKHCRCWPPHVGGGATYGWRHMTSYHPETAALTSALACVLRFAGYETVTAEKTGGVAIPDAASYVECAVQSKMDTGDHWVLYAEVIGGKVLNDSLQTAMHHRKTGASY